MCLGLVYIVGHVHVGLPRTEGVCVAPLGVDVCVYGGVLPVIFVSVLTSRQYAGISPASYYPQLLAYLLRREHAFSERRPSAVRAA